MKTDNLTADTIGRYIPNLLTEVEGETPLAEKLAPFISSAKIRLERDFLGPDDFLSDAHNELALKILVAQAFADAVPSLDLVVTPNGMAVINTDNLAPASKERVERLIASLRDYVRVNLDLLVEICRTYPQWRRSERGQYYCSTFLSSLSDSWDIPSMKDAHYDHVRLCCIVIENELADRYLGREFIKKLRDEYNSGVIPKSHPLIAAIRAADLAMLGAVGGALFDQNRLWRAARPVLNELNNWPEYKAAWEAEMEDKFKVPAFVNNIKGGYYF